MKTITKIKKWQLVRHKSRKAAVDLSDEDFITVGNRAFSGNLRLEELTLPSHLSAIKSEAFHRCKRLKALRLHREVPVGISNAAFYNCQRLHTVNVGV